MKRLDLIARVRANTRDFSNSIFREQDIIDYINEGVMRFKQIIPELNGLSDLLVQSQEPNLIPKEYHHLIALYASSRCFSQDERYYQATTLMNEFEVKLGEFKDKVESGEVVITDPITGVAVTLTDNPIDYVDVSYFDENGDPVELSDGVEEVQG